MACAASSGHGANLRPELTDLCILLDTLFKITMEKA